MRFEQIIAVVARVFAIVEVRWNRAVGSFANVFQATCERSYRRLHSEWQLLLGATDDASGLSPRSHRRGHTSGMSPTGMPGQPMLVAVTCPTTKPTDRKRRG